MRIVTRPSAPTGMCHHQSTGTHPIASGPASTIRLDNDSPVGTASRSTTARTSARGPSSMPATRSQTSAPAAATPMSTARGST